MSNLRPMRARDILIQAVTTLPTGADRYEGREVDYYPSGAFAMGPVWRCVWRAALNSGSGAWAVVSGAPLIDLQTSSHDVNAGSTTISNMAGITVPVSGIYDLDIGGSVQLRTAPSGVVNVSLFYRRDSTNIVRASVYHARNQFESSTHSAPLRQTLTGGWVLTLRAELLSASTTFRFGGDDVPMSLILRPVELRP